jgi:hypothetical protein
MTTTTGTKPVAPKTIPDLPADLEAGLRRLKLAAVRRTAPEVLQVAQTQRWTPERVLRTLIEAEIAARDASNEAIRLKAAAFPVIKTLDGFDISPPHPSRRPPSSTCPVWNGYAHNTIWRLFARRAPARVISLGSDAPPSTPATRCATSPPPTSSTPSIATVNATTAATARGARHHPMLQRRGGRRR